MRPGSRGRVLRPSHLSLVAHVWQQDPCLRGAVGPAVIPGVWVASCRGWLPRLPSIRAAAWRPGAACAEAGRGDQAQMLALGGCSLLQPPVLLVPKV